jgi:hypothetical protein
MPESRLWCVQQEFSERAQYRQSWPRADSHEDIVTFAAFPVELPDPLRWIAHPQTVTLAAYEEFCEMVRDVGAVLQDGVAVEVPIDLARHDVWIVVTGVGLPHAHTSPQLFPVTPGKFTARAPDCQPRLDDRRPGHQPIHKLFEDSRH